MIENQFRLNLYGNKPYKVAFIHGGPGAAGEMSAVCEYVATKIGVIEPFQTKYSIKEQILELKDQIRSVTDERVILFGFSYGAWLSLLFTYEFPEIVDKVVLISSGPFHEKYAKDLFNKRINRLSKNQRNEVFELQQKISSGDLEDSILSKFGELMQIADTYEKGFNDNSKVEADMKIFNKIWNEAAGLRKSGKLIDIIKNIKVPIEVVHGEYDSHPYKGVIEPLKEINKSVKFHLLERCGHKPWIEKYAREHFFTLLFSIIK